MSTNVVVTALDSGNANPDLAFRFDPGLVGYIFNLSTRGLATGIYELEWLADGDSVLHSTKFGVK